MADNFQVGDDGLVTHAPDIAETVNWSLFRFMVHGSNHVLRKNYCRYVLIISMVALLASPPMLAALKVPSINAQEWTVSTSSHHCAFIDHTMPRKGFVVHDKYAIYLVFDDNIGENSTEKKLPLN